MADTDPAMVKLAEALGEVLARPAAQTPATPEGAPAAPTPEIPAVAVPPEAVALATPAAPGQLPEGILPLEELQRQERQGSSSAEMSHAERMRANEQFCASAEYHIKNGSI